MVRKQLGNIPLPLLKIIEIELVQMDTQQKIV
jgi:hypothetical protein